MMSTNKPIGLFDSGVGGTSIWKEILTTLPAEDTIYLADIHNAPYGERSPQEIVEFSIKNAEKLLKFNCKIIVVACNTATTNAIDILRRNYEVPFIGIEPAIKPAALASKSKVIGILATKGTLSSSLFHRTSELYASNLKVIEVVGKGLVELIEADQITSNEMYALLQSYIKPMIEEKIDYLVLGCSHYPYLIPILKKMLPPDVQIIDSGRAVALQTRNILLKFNLLNSEENQGQHKLFSNASTAVLKKLSDVENNKVVNVSYLDF